ncbi:MAG TPA: penicillin-binding protein 2 [Bryobacteraceae bacterium]|nr:penicillin-binding protein 2 [Bryobacteraceae bacterium]
MSLSLHNDDPHPLTPVIRDEDTKFAAGRIAFFQYLAVGVFLFLITSFWELQVRDPERYSQAAERNRIKSQPILAPRGKILDRDGRVIVDNRSSYSLLLSREHLKREHIRTIALGLNMDYEELESRIERFSSRPEYESIIIKSELTPGEVAFVEAHRDPETFPEMELIHAQRRLYPKDGLAAHVIGYVGEISEAELNEPQFIDYDQGAVIGKAGLEREYNHVLMGVDGQRQVVVDNRGRVRSVRGIKEATPGRNLQLTLDLDVQVVAELAMQGHTGSVVALDPRNGEVLAMVSTPSYDPNKFAGGIRASDWKELISNPDNPMLNRAIQAQFAPGSTFKPIMALAGLESGAIDDDFRVHCPGGATFYGRYFRCWEKRGHGTVDLHKAIVQSCDVYFYNAGNRMGVDTIAKYAEMTGLGRKTGIDLPNEMPGLVPSSEWKMRTFRQKWYAGETISVAIGQGALTVTPLQLAYSIGGLAIGGVWHRPHLVKDPEKVEKPRIAKIDPAVVQKIVAGMYGVANEGGGTGGRARLPGISVCGKTGTAQRISNQAAKGALGRMLRDNAWFVAFAPCEAPEISVAVLVEGGEHGWLAAPIARDVIKAYFDKKARRQRQSHMAELRRSVPQFGPVGPEAAPAVTP